MVLAPAIPPGFGLFMQWLEDHAPAGAGPPRVNPSDYCPWCGGPTPQTKVTQRGRSRLRLPRAKPKRKVSRYQRAFGACLKDLKRQHPRTPTSRLMKRAHTCAKKKKRKGGW